MSKNNVVNLGLNVKGETRYKLIDTRTGKVDEESDWKDNLLLYGYLNGFFTKDRPLLENNLFDNLYLGDGGSTAPARSQTGLQGNTLGSKSYDSIIEGYDYSGKYPYNNEILNYTGHSNYVNSVAFSSDDSMVVSGDWENIIQVWNVSDGSLVTEYTGHSDTVRSVEFSSDDSMVVSGSWDDTVQVWNVSDGSLVTEYTGHSSPVYSVAFSSDDSMVVSGSYDDIINPEVIGPVMQFTMSMNILYTLQREKESE